MQTKLKSIISVSLAMTILIFLRNLTRSAFAANVLPMKSFKTASAMRSSSKSFLSHIYRDHQLESYYWTAVFELKKCPTGEIRKSDPATECESCAANQISSPTGCIDCENEKVASGDKCITCQSFEIIFTETSGVRVSKACAANEIVSNGQCTACPDGQIRNGK